MKYESAEEFSDIVGFAESLGIDTTGMSVGDLETALDNFDTSTQPDPDATDDAIAAALDKLGAYADSTTLADQQSILDGAADSAYRDAVKDPDEPGVLQAFKDLLGL